MTAINHALTGALIGLVSGQPLLAIPAAFASHFVCDALPHFGSRQSDEVYLKTRQFKVLLALDSVLCALLVVLLWRQHPLHWALAAVCAFTAASPDLWWVGKFVRVQLRGDASSKDWFDRFATWIQWFQRPSGALVEAVWAVGASILLWQFVR